MERLWGHKPGARAHRPDGAGLLARFRLHAGCCCETHDLTSNTQDPVAQGVYRYADAVQAQALRTPSRTMRKQVSTGHSQHEASFLPGAGVTEEYSVALV